MKRILIIGGGALAAYWLLNRFAGGSSEGVGAAAPPALFVPPKVTGGFVQTGPGVGALAPVYGLFRPIADNITTPLINAANRSVGGVNPYGAPSAPTKNAAGQWTQTDPLGATITYNPDGTYTRKNPSFSQTNGGKFIIRAGSDVKQAAVGVTHFVEGLF